MVGETIVKVKQEGDELLFSSNLTGAGEIGFIERYFRLDDDLPHILHELYKDERIVGIIRKFYGLRILRQDPWECLVSYICSRNTNIRKIRSVVTNISTFFGNPINLGGHVGYTFPEPGAIAEAKLSDLERCRFRFGRRQAGEIKEIAKRVNEGGLDLEGLREMRRAVEQARIGL